MTSHHDWFGVDVSKKTLDVFAPNFGTFQFPNSEDGREAFAAKLSCRAVAGVVMEATGGYEQPLFKLLNERGINASVVNPARVRAFATGTGQLAKTDRIDAGILASYARLKKPAPQPLPSSTRAKLKELLTYRGQIVAEVTARIAQIRHYGDAGILARAEAAVAALRDEKKAIEGEIDSLVKAEAYCAEIFAILTSVPGAGIIVAATLIAELPELGTLSRRQIASLAGLAPFPRESVQRKGYRAIRGGRAEVRHVLYNAAIVAKRHNPKIRVFADRLAAKSKPYKVIIVAAMRKLLTILNAMLKSRETWRNA